VKIRRGGTAESRCFAASRPTRFVAVPLLGPGQAATRGSARMVSEPVSTRRRRAANVLAEPAPALVSPCTSTRQTGGTRAGARGPRSRGGPSWVFTVSATSAPGRLHPSCTRLAGDVCGDRTGARLPLPGGPGILCACCGRRTDGVDLSPPRPTRQRCSVARVAGPQAGEAWRMRKRRLRAVRGLWTTRAGKGMRRPWPSSQLMSTSP